MKKNLIFSKIIILICVFIFTSLSIGQQQESDCVKIKIYCEDIVRIAEYFPIVHTQLDMFLLKAGFEIEKAVPLPIWSQFTPIRKFEVACIAANRFYGDVSEENCRKLILIVAKCLKEQYPISISEFKSATLMLYENLESNAKINFSYKGNKIYDASRLSKEIIKDIVKLLDPDYPYFMPMSLFYMSAFDVSEEDFFEKMTNANVKYTPDGIEIKTRLQEAILAKMIERHDMYGEPTVFATMQYIVSKRDEDALTFRADSRFDQYRILKKSTDILTILPQGPSNQTAIPTSQGGPGGDQPKNPSSTNNITQQRNDYIKQNSDWNAIADRDLSGRNLTSFQRAILHPNTAGGVIFGNQIRTDPELGKPLTAQFELYSPQSQQGRLIINFQKGALNYSSTLEGVNLQGIIAAKNIYFSTDEDLKIEPRDTLGKAISLAGLVDRNKTTDCFKMIVHPAISSKKLGWNAIFIDLFHINPSTVFLDKNNQGYYKFLHNNYMQLNDFELFSKHNLNFFYVLIKTVLINKFNYLKRVSDNYLLTWKLHDVQTIISRDTSINRLIIERSDGKDTFPLGLRRTLFLNMRLIFGEPKNPQSWLQYASSGSDYAKKFYWKLALLVQTNKDFARLNDFARTMAVVRWLRASGATFVPIRGQELFSEARTPDWIKFQDDYIAKCN